MSPDRVRMARTLVLLWMAAWTIYCGFFFATLATPAIEGGSEATDSFRLVIVGGWLAGMSVGVASLYAVGNRRVHAVPYSTRGYVAIAALLATVVFVAALVFLNRAGILVFAWGPIAVALLLIVAWASVSPKARKRLGQSLLVWSSGLSTLAAFWFLLPPRTLGLHFWSLLGLLTLMSIGWWAVPLIDGAGAGARSFWDRFTAMDGPRIMWAIAIVPLAFVLGFLAAMAFIFISNALLPPFVEEVDDDTAREYVPVALTYLTWAVTTVSISVFGIRRLLRQGANR